MTKTRKSKRVPFILGLAVIAALCALYIYAYHGKGLPPSSEPPSFDGGSGALERTAIVATLDAPIEQGKNTIWSASFQAAWKVLQNDLAKGPVVLEGNGTVVEALNRASSPASDVPAGSLYAAAGWEDKGILQEISRDLKQQFPEKAAPTFPGIARGSFVAYSYLEASTKFGMPYFQNRKPLAFKDSGGRETPVSSFGIRPEDEDAYLRLREQPRILFSTEEDLSPTTGKGMRPREFAIDLDRTSEPTQVVVARVEPKRTLEETLDSVERKVAASHIPVVRSGLSPFDVLLVPDMFWSISHRFRELEGRSFQNTTLKRQPIHVAQEDITFRLDRSGAELRAESKIHAQSAPTYYLFDGPFLIYMKKRGASRPYFAIWVDNAELLRGK